MVLTPTRTSVECALWPQQRIYFLGGAMTSLAALATRNLTTVLALILMVSPVWGLRPSPCLPLCLYQPAEPRDDEHAILLCLLHCCLCQQIEKCCGLLVGQLKFFCQCPDQCCLGHACCHSVSFFRLVCSWAHGRVFRTLENPCRKRFSRIRGPAVKRASILTKPSVYAGKNEPTAVYDAAFKNVCQPKNRELFRFWRVFPIFFLISPVGSQTEAAAFSE